jgi:hypothetical protein
MHPPPSFSTTLSNLSRQPARRLARRRAEESRRFKEPGSRPRYALTAKLTALAPPVISCRICPAPCADGEKCRWAWLAGAVREAPNTR